MIDKATAITGSRLIWDCWARHAKECAKKDAIIHWDALDKPFRWTYSALFDAALNFAGYLMDCGVKKGDICALVMRHNKSFYPIYMGISMSGAIPAVLAYPNTRLHPDKFAHGLSGMTANACFDWIITERELEQAIKPYVSNEAISVKGMLFPLEWSGGRAGEELYEKIKKKQEKIDCAAPFLLQFSSGTTGLQKGVVLSHRAVLEHANRYSKTIRMSPEDKVISWLPLYHDMGLIAAFHIPLIYGIPVVQIDPFQWISAPSILFDAISREKTTLTWLPNFAYDFMAARVNEEEMRSIDLSSMKMFINCSEVVRARSHKKFLKCFGKYGVKKTSLAACYAMAEATFAVTQTSPGAELSEIAAGKKNCVSSGAPIPGCSLKIVDKKGKEVPEGHIGSVVIKSASLFDGYFKNPEKTREVMKDGWYFSRDLGFCRKGEYYILGREDDVIIIAGRNIYPEDIEDAVNELEGVIAGRVVAFGVEDTEAGTQKACVIAETSYEKKEDREGLRMSIIKAGMDIDITISTVYLVTPRWLIKSSAGKLSRSANKKRILET